MIVATFAGAVGALSRYLVSGVVQARADSDLPWGTIAVNLIGAFLIGLVAGAGDPAAGTTHAAVGFLGGLTTYSTWMIETVRLGITTLRGRALFNLAVPLLGGLLLVAAGYSLTT